MLEEFRLLVDVEPSLQDRENRRRAERVPILLPASLESGTHHYNAKLLNIVPGGAMFESNAPLAACSPVVVRCGTVIANAVIAWRKDDRVGVRFEIPLAGAQLAE